jgi:hypothetical protein
MEPLPLIKALLEMCILQRRGAIVQAVHRKTIRLLPPRGSVASWSAPVHGNSPESAVVRGTKGCSIRTGVNPSERLKTRMKASDSNRAVTR